jgi:hypothetical protein
LIIAFVTLILVAIVVAVGFNQLLVAVVLILITALTALLFEAGAAFAKNAVIMIRKLQIIFGLHAVAGELRIARHALVFLKQLRGIATLTIVLPITLGPAANVLRPLPPTTATAAPLAIIDQVHFPSKKQKVAPWPARQPARTMRRSDPLVPIQRGIARNERPIASGVDGMRSAYSQGEAGPILSMDVVR